TTTTDDQGLATSARLSANAVAGNYLVTASSGGFSALFNLTNFEPTPETPYSVSPEVLVFRYEIGAALPPAQTATVTTPHNSFTFGTETPWVKAQAVPHGSLNDTLSISVDPKGLAPSTYYTSFWIEGRPLLDVYLQVVAAPQIVPSRRTMSF